MCLYTLVYGAIYSTCLNPRISYLVFKKKSLLLLFAIKTLIQSWDLYLQGESYNWNTVEDGWWLSAILRLTWQWISLIFLITEQIIDFCIKCNGPRAFTTRIILFKHYHYEYYDYRPEVDCEVSEIFWQNKMSSMKTLRHWLENIESIVQLLRPRKQSVIHTHRSNVLTC